MPNFTAVIPARSILPPDLALLHAPIRVRKPGDPAGHAGRCEGVVLDALEHVIAFIVRLSPQLAPTHPRTLVAASAVTGIKDAVLQLSLTEAELLQQPRLDDALHVPPPSGESDPLATASLQASTVEGVSEESTKEALEEGAGGAAIGAVVGTVAGIVAGGPIVLGVAAFFALSGGLIGLISGASRRTNAEINDLVTLDPGRETPSDAALRQLGERLQDPALLDGDLVQMMRFSRASAVVVNDEEPLS
ncbi:MAG: hypothetical protein ABI193_04770 [Minicystis sp.]